MVADFTGNSYSLWGDETLGTNALNQDEMLQVISEVQTIDSHRND